MIFCDRFSQNIYIFYPRNIYILSFIILCYKFHFFFNFIFLILSSSSLSLSSLNFLFWYFHIFLEFLVEIWRPPSLSELTSIIFNMELIHLGSEASNYPNIFQKFTFLQSIRNVANMLNFKIIFLTIVLRSLKNIFVKRT